MIKRIIWNHDDVLDFGTSRFNDFKSLSLRMILINYKKTGFKSKTKFTRILLDPEINGRSLVTIVG